MGQNPDHMMTTIPVSKIVYKTHILFYQQIHIFNHVQTHQTIFVLPQEANIFGEEKSCLVILYYSNLLAKYFDFTSIYPTQCYTCLDSA